MRRPTRRQLAAILCALVVLPVACAKVLGIEPAHERIEEDAGGGSIIDATPPLEDGALPPLGEKDASCGDTTSDPKNCGACGLDCRGGKCTSGRCEPLVFVYGLLRPSQLAVTDEGIYWTDALASGPGAGVRRCDLAGCQNGMPRTLYERPNVSYQSIVVDGDTVLALRGAWAGIDVCDKLGCSGSPALINVPATSLAVAGQKAHYTVPSGVPTGSTSALPPDAGVWRCEGLPYCYPRTHIATKGTAIRAQGADLYVLDNGSQNTGVLLRCVGGNCTAPKTLASGLAYVFPKFFASQQGIGWISQSSSGIHLYMCDPQSCAGGPKALATLGGYVDNFAFDAKYIYWANSEYSTIDRVAWASTNAATKPEIVLTKQGLPIGIQMREGAIYFTRSDFGDIVRWTPPP